MQKLSIQIQKSYPYLIITPHVKTNSRQTPNLSVEGKAIKLTEDNKENIFMTLQQAKHGCCFSVTQSCLTLCDPWTAARQAYLSFTISWSLLKLMSIESVMPSNHLILWYPFLLLPSISPSIRFFPNESTLYIRWPKYWSFSFSISPSNEYSGLISFKIDWFDLLAVQRTLKGLYQHRSSKALILQHSAFFIVQLSHPYMNTGKLQLLLYRSLSQINVSAFSYDMQVCHSFSSKKH